jgi:hypothetical protein
VLHSTAAVEDHRFHSRCSRRWDGRLHGIGGQRGCTLLTPTALSLSAFNVAVLERAEEGFAVRSEPPGGSAARLLH